MMETAWKEMQAWVELNDRRAGKTEKKTHKTPGTITEPEKSENIPNSEYSENSEKSFKVRYYKSPSAFRCSGALVPPGLNFTYRLSPFMGCEQCSVDKNPYCFENYNPWWKKGEIKVKTNTKELLTSTLDRDTKEWKKSGISILMDGFDNIFTERKTGVLRDCLIILSDYPVKIHIQTGRTELLEKYKKELADLGERVTIWLSVADELTFNKDVILDLKESGINIILNILLFPLINTGEEKLSPLQKFAEENKIKLSFTWLRLQHKGPQRDAVIKWIKDKYGRETAEKYSSIYPAEIPAGKYGRIPVKKDY